MESISNEEVSIQSKCTDNYICLYSSSSSSFFMDGLVLSISPLVLRHSLSFHLNLLFSVSKYSVVNLDTSNTTGKGNSLGKL